MADTSHSQPTDRPAQIDVHDGQPLRVSKDGFFSQEDDFGIAAKLRWIWMYSGLFLEYLESDTDESGETLRKALVAFEFPRKPDR